MQITTGAAITITGLIAGINIIGLFFAVWLMDRQSRHMQAYFFGAVLLGLKGVSEIGILTGILPISFQNASNVLDTAGLLLFARGVAWDFQLSGVVGKVSLVAAISMAASLSLAFVGSESVWLRLASSASANGLLLMIVAWAALFAPRATFVTRLSGSGAFLLSLNYLLLHPFLAYRLSLIGGLSEADRHDAFLGITNTSFVVLAFGTGAVLFFHTMNKLISNYRNASMTDPMTGLWNRRGFFCSRAARQLGRGSLIMLDIDHFKNVNDRFGHEAGDQVIIQVSSVLQQGSVLNAVCGRLGGEEFGILLPNVPLAAAEAHAHALRLAVETLMIKAEALELQVTASFGVAEYSGGDLNDVLRRADTALYAAKNGGRNRVCAEGQAEASLKAAA